LARLRGPHRAAMLVPVVATEIKHRNVSVDQAFFPTSTRATVNAQRVGRQARRQTNSNRTGSAYIRVVRHRHGQNGSSLSRFTEKLIPLALKYFGVEIIGP
jgi:hypothetical protein